MLRKISLTSATNTKWKPLESYIIIVLKKHLTLSVMSIYSSPRYEKMYMLWFNFILGLNFIFFCFKLIIIRYHTQKHREIRFKPRTKLNHKIYSQLFTRMCLCKLLLGKIKTDFLPLTISLVYEKVAELSRRLLLWFYSQKCLDDISHKHSQSLYYTNILYLLGQSWGTGIKHILRCLKFCLHCTHVSTKAT